MYYLKKKLFFILVIYNPKLLFLYYLIDHTSYILTYFRNLIQFYSVFFWKKTKNTNIFNISAQLHQEIEIDNTIFARNQLFYIHGVHSKYHQSRGFHDL